MSNFGEYLYPRAVITGHFVQLLIYPSRHSGTFCPVAYIPEPLLAEHFVQAKCQVMTFLGRIITDGSELRLGYIKGAGQDRSFVCSNVVPDLVDVST